MTISPSVRSPKISDQHDRDDRHHHADGEIAEIALEEAVAILVLDLRLETREGGGEAGAVLLVDGDLAVTPLDPVEDHLLALRQPVLALRLGLVGPGEHDIVAGVVEDEQPLGGERQRRGGKIPPAALAPAPVVDVAGERRRYALGRIEQRDDGPLRRVAADGVPGDEVEAEDADEAEAADGEALVVEEPVPEALRAARRRDQPRRNLDRDRKPFPRRKHARGRDLERVVAEDLAFDNSGRARRNTRYRPSTAPAPCRQAARSATSSSRIGNDQSLPVTFQNSSVWSGKEPDLPAGRVAELVGVVAGREVGALLAHVDADALAVGVGVVRLGPAVPGHRHDVEGDVVHRPVVVLEGEREIAVDAAPDLVALSLDRDRLGDVENAVALHHDVRDEGQDLLGGQRPETRDRRGRRTASAKRTIVDIGVSP